MDFSSENVFEMFVRNGNEAGFWIKRTTWAKVPRKLYPHCNGIGNHHRMLGRVSSDGFSVLFRHASLNLYPKFRAGGQAQVS